MTTIQLVKLIIKVKHKKEIAKLLNNYRITIKRSKYC